MSNQGDGRNMLRSVTCGIDPYGSEYNDEGDTDNTEKLYARTTKFPQVFFTTLGFDGFSLALEKIKLIYTTQIENNVSVCRQIYSITSSRLCLNFKFINFMIL